MVPPRRGRATPPTACTSVHTVGADCISAQNRLHRPPALYISHHRLTRPMAGTFGDGASNTSVRTGGYKIRPYGPASGFLVGAGFMPARNQVPIPAGVRWSRLVGADAHIGPPPPRVRATPPTACTSVHTVGADFISARNRLHRPPAPGISHPVPAPLRCIIDLVRRAGCPHPAKPARRNHWARGPRSPAMAACGHAALQN